MENEESLKLELDIIFHSARLHFPFNNWQNEKFSVDAGKSLNENPESTKRKEKNSAKSFAHVQPRDDRNKDSFDSVSQRINP